MKWAEGLYGREGNKKTKAYAVALIVLAAVAVKIALSSPPEGLTVYVAADGSGDFNCDGIDDQIEINKALEYVAKHPEYEVVYLKGPNTYVISDSLYVGSNTVIEGDRTAAVKLKDGAGWQKDKPLITQLNSSGNSGITIKGFEIDGNHDGKADIQRGKG